ncbi:uncharacterized protein [Bemisia tabaci]|uniref:uncharacterized protein n=1 Tax=Bemisia tabaci TaxID=7038 RepID=UPI003B28B54F
MFSLLPTTGSGQVGNACSGEATGENRDMSSPEIFPDFSSLLNRLGYPQTNLCDSSPI